MNTHTIKSLIRTVILALALLAVLPCQAFSWNPVDFVCSSSYRRLARDAYRTLRRGSHVHRHYRRSYDRYFRREARRAERMARKMDDRYFKGSEKDFVNLPDEYLPVEQGGTRVRQDEEFVIDVDESDIPRRPYPGSNAWEKVDEEMEDWSEEEAEAAAKAVREMRAKKGR